MLFSSKNTGPIGKYNEKALRGSIPRLTDKLVDGGSQESTPMAQKPWLEIYALALQLHPEALSWGNQENVYQNQRLSHTYEHHHM